MKTLKILQRIVFFLFINTLIFMTSCSEKIEISPNHFTETPSFEAHDPLPPHLQPNALFTPQSTSLIDNKKWIERNRIFCINESEYGYVLNSLSQEKDVPTSLFLSEEDKDYVFLKLKNLLPYESDGEKVKMLFSASERFLDRSLFIPLYIGEADFFTRNHTFKPIGIHFNPSTGIQTSFLRLGLDWKSYGMSPDNKNILYAQLKPSLNSQPRSLESHFIWANLSEPQKVIQKWDLDASRFYNPRLFLENNYVFFDHIPLKESRIRQSIIQTDASFNFIKKTTLPLAPHIHSEWTEKAHQLGASWVDSDTLLWLETLKDQSILRKINIHTLMEESITLPLLNENNFWFPQFILLTQKPQITLAMLNYEFIGIYELTTQNQLLLKKSIPLPLDVQKRIKDSLDGGFFNKRTPLALKWSEKFNELYLILPSQYHNVLYKASLKDQTVTPLMNDSCKKVSFVFERFER